MEREKRDICRGWKEKRESQPHMREKEKAERQLVTLEQTKNYSYLGKNTNAKGNFNKAVNDLRDKARQ